MAAELGRRAVLAFGGLGLAAGAAATPAGAAIPSTALASGILFFDPHASEARALAAAARGQRLIAVEGDPVRLWRDGSAGARGPVAGVTRWSDYLILRGLAEEQGWRLDREERVARPGGPMLVSWSMAYRPA